jgi:hypothetical protein
LRGFGGFAAPRDAKLAFDAFDFGLERVALGVGEIVRAEHLAKLFVLTDEREETLYDLAHVGLNLLRARRVFAMYGEALIETAAKLARETIGGT